MAPSGSKRSGSGGSSGKNHGKSRRGKSGTSPNPKKKKATKPPGNNQDDVDQNAKIKELKDQIEALQKENEDRSTPSSTRSRSVKGHKDGGAVYIPQNKTLKAAVENVVKEDVWPTTKFICSESHISEVCEFVAKNTDEIHELIKKNPTKTDAIYKSFEEKYGDFICTTLNQHRTNCQANVKKWWQKREQEGKPMPTIDELREIIMRKGLKYNKDDVKKNLQNRHWFQWYHTGVIQVCGKTRYGHNIRKQGPISTIKDEGGNKYVTSSDEAFLLLCLENSEQRLQYTAECRKNGKKPDPKH